MPAPSIVDYGTFYASTRLGSFNGRKSLETLDGLLKLCPGLAAMSVVDRLALMDQIIQGCQTWKQAKAPKPGETEPANTAKRRVPVESLLLQARKRFAYERFEQKKQAARVRPPGAPTPTAALHGGYRPEREQFLAERARMRAAGTYDRAARITPIGGSFAHEIHEEGAKFPGMVVLRPKAFREFTVEDYQAYKASGALITQAPLVHYMRKSERLNHLVTVKDGLFVQRGALFSTTGMSAKAGEAAIEREYMYVMDVYGNLFITNHNAAGRVVEGDASQFNHSSLNAGDVVICAGTMNIWQGVLKQITNYSGHYLPSVQNLAECARTLQNDGASFRETRVMVLAAGFELPLGPWTVEELLRDPDSCTRPRPVRFHPRGRPRSAVDPSAPPRPV